MDYKHERPKFLEAGLIVKRAKVKKLETFYKQDGKWYSVETNKEEKRGKQ